MVIQYSTTFVIKRISRCRIIFYISIYDCVLQKYLFQSNWCRELPGLLPVCTNSICKESKLLKDRFNVTMIETAVSNTNFHHFIVNLKGFYNCITFQPSPKLVPYRAVPIFKITILSSPVKNKVWNKVCQLCCLVCLSLYYSVIFKSLELQ